jgi:hypothetical protein
VLECVDCLLFSSLIRRSTRNEKPSQGTSKKNRGSEEENRSVAYQELTAGQTKR